MAWQRISISFCLHFRHWWSLVGFLQTLSSCPVCASQLKLSIFLAIDITESFLRKYIKTFLLGCPLNHLHGKSSGQQTKLETKPTIHTIGLILQEKSLYFCFFLFMFVSAVSADEGMSTELLVAEMALRWWWTMECLPLGWYSTVRAFNGCWFLGNCGQMSRYLFLV